MACYVDGFTFLYVDDFHISQGSHLWSSRACYVDSFAYFYFKQWKPVDIAKKSSENQRSPYLTFAPKWKENAAVLKQ
jgi:hypothetical protein